MHAQPPDHDTTTLDPIHRPIVDAQMTLDAKRVADLGHGFVRRYVEHELCQPNRPCTTWPTIVMVIPVAPGVRLRVPYSGVVMA